MKKNASTRSQARLFVVFALLIISVGIVAAIYAFPGAGAGNTVLVAQACNTGSNSATPGAFTGACTTSLINSNDGTNQTSVVANNNRYAGINMTAYNSSITNCGSITNVKLCYEWWYNSAAVTLDTCRVKVDADGGASYTNVSTSCPSVTANPGETCIDVTGSESWVCGDFFTSSGTRAMAVVEVLFPSAKTLSVDSLYFNVTYTADLVAPIITIASPANTTYTSLPLTLNTTIVDDNLQACWWSNNSGATNRTFTCNTNITLGGNVSIGSNKLFVWANDSYGNNASSSVTFFVNIAPTVQNISISPNPAGISALMTVVANNVTDRNNESLSFFCSESSSSPTDNGLCSGGGNLTNINFPYSPSCSYYHSRAAGNYTVYCRMYDGVSYSPTVNKTYQVLGDTLTTSVISVAGDTTPSYYDTINDARTDILVSGATGMSCRWSSSDFAYSGMSSACTINGSTANCSVNNVAVQNFTTRYIACQDSYGNSQTAATNLNVDFYLDYTAPTTSDDSDAQIHVPTYEVTITEADNVDLDPTSYYCFSVTPGCTPSFSIDGGSVISFGTANRDINYLRYYSIDDALNAQTIVNKTIKINHLPLLTSASDNAATILGGTTVTVTTVSSDEDSANQTINLYVCNESGAIYSGCNGGTYCSATGTANLSCGFASEFDSGTHTWYAYIYDSLGEAASSNNPLTGFYVTDSSGPNIVVVSPLTTSYTQTSVSADIVTSETASSAWYNLDGNSTTNVTMSNVSSTNWVSTISGLFVGNHNITFYANDSFGNIGGSSRVNFIITSPNDTTPPAITILTPANASYSSTSPLLNISSDEALSSAWYKLNGGSSVYLNSSTTTSWYTTLSGLSQEVVNNLTVFANDTSNNQNNRSIVIYVDSRAPRYSSALAVPSPSNQSQNVNCSATWTDGFNITSVIISENSLGSYENHTISFSGISGSSSYVIVGSKLTNAGSYTCRFYATDAAGNINSTSTTFTVNDVIAPTITVTSPGNFTYNQVSVLLSLLTSENVSSAWYKLNGGANTSLGNTSSTSWNASLSGLSNGVSYSIIFYANDSSNNIGNSSNITFTINTGLADTIPPVLTSTLANASYKISSTIPFNVSSNENLNWSGYTLNGGSLTNLSNSSLVLWNGSLTGLTSGSTNTLIIYGNDSANNRGNLTVVFYFDNQAPNFTNVSASPNPSNETQSVICNAYINDSFGLGNVKISENASVPGSFQNHTIDLFSRGYANYTITNVQKGNYTCIFYATDVAGNTNSTSTTFAVNDVTAPSLTVTSPTNATYGSSSIVASLVTSENASSAWYSFDGGANTSLSGSAKSWSTTLTSQNLGSHNVRFYANDSSNNIGNSSLIYFTVVAADSVPPVIVVDTILNGSYKSSTSVQLNITTNEDITLAGYRVNGGSLTSMTNSSTRNWNATISGLVGESTNTLIVYANDTSNNQGNTTLVFYVDSVAPRFLNVSASPNPANEAQSVICSAYVNDSFSLSLVKISENSTNSGVFMNHTDVYSSGWANYTILGVQKGNYTCIFYATDIAGNTNSTSTTFKVNDITPPVISINSPLNQSYSNNYLLFSITTNENVVGANYSLNGGNSNTSLSGSSKSWSDTVIINDGVKNLTFYAVDGSGNIGSSSVSFAIDTSVNDITPPAITIWSPVDGAYYTSSTMLLNISTNENLSWAGYKLDSDPILNLGNVSMINWNKTLTSVSEGAHSVIFYANDSSTNKNQGNKTTNVYIDLNVPSVGSFSCPDKNDSQDVVCTLTATDAVGLDYVIFGDNSSGSWKNSSQIDLSGVSNTTAYTLSAGNTTPGVFGMKLYLFDMAGRMNGSESDLVNIRDDTNPIIGNISYSPNTTALLDPGISVNISADIAEDYAIGSVKLMYKNSSAASWTSVTMTNTTFKNYNASLLSLGAETWYFKINATDAAGNSNLSSNYTLDVQNDLSYNITSSIPLIKSISSAQITPNNSLGTLYMNNTGDGSLDFNVTLSSVSLGTRLSVNYTSTQNVNYTGIVSGGFRNIIIDVNTTGLDNGLYVYQINIVSSAGTSSYENYVNIQAVAQPYLVVSIDSYSSSVIRGQTGVELKASVSNFGSLDATGVYLSWNLPSGFSLSSGSLIRSLGNIPIGSSSTNTITFDVSSSITNTSEVISAEAIASNADSDSESRNVSVTDALVVVVTEVVSGGSGGGGGGGGAVMSKTYSKTIEVVRGSGDKFEIEVNNKDYNYSLEDVTIDISGFPSNYISVSPSKIGYIAPRGTGKFVVKLSAPAYKSYEEHDLIAIIKGTLKSATSSQAYSETQNIKLIIQEISKDASNLSLSQAEEAIKEMKDKGFNTDNVVSLLNQANVQLSEKKNKEAYNLAEEVVKIKEKAVRVDNLIKRIRAVMENPRKVSLIVGNVAKDIGSEKGAIYLIEQMKNNNNLFDGVSSENYNGVITGKVVINEAEINEVLGLALVAFERGDYDIAESRAEAARNLLLLNLKGNFGIFLYLNWPFIALGMVLLSVSGFVGYRRYQKSSVAKRIEDLDKEETNIGTLMVISQRKYFLGRMSSGDYHRITFQNQKRLADLRKERINLRNKRIKIVSPREISQNLEIEKMQVEASIRKIQSAYYADKKISESEYNLQFKVFNERLAEIEDERITLRLIEERKGPRTIKARDFKVNEIAHKDVVRTEHKIESSGKTHIFFLKLWGFLKKPFSPIKTIGDRRREAREKEIRKKIDKMLREKK